MKIFIDSERNEYDLDELNDVERLVDRLDKGSQFIIELKKQLDSGAKITREQDNEVYKLHKYLTTTMDALMERDNKLFLKKIVPILEKYSPDIDNDGKTPENVQLARDILGMLCTDSTYAQIKEAFIHEKFDSLNSDFYEVVTRIVISIGMIANKWPIFMSKELRSFIDSMGKENMEKLTKNIKHITNDELHDLLNNFYKFVLGNSHRIRSECLKLLI